MDELKNAIAKLIAEASTGASLQDLMERFCDALKEHSDLLGGLAGRYRLTTKDSGFSIAFELGENQFALLSSDDKVDATITAGEGDLLALIRRELNPMVAMFTGKIKIEGSMQALSKFAQLF